MNRLCTICARGGSKGVHNKNVRMLAGMPLIAHTVTQALDSGLFACVAVSSDSWPVLKMAQLWGARELVARPDEMAGDLAPKLPAIRHCAATVERRAGLAYDTFVDLDVTAPLRAREDLRGAVAMLEAAGRGNLVTGVPARRSPYFNLVERRPDGTVGLAKPPPRLVARRQDAPPCFDLNASIYAWTRESFLRDDPRVLREDTLLYEMPEERSLDIDSELDWRIVEMLSRERMGRS